MDITNVEVKRFNGETRLKGIATITIESCFVVHDIKLIEGKDSDLFIGMPSRKMSNGEFVDIVHPINQETRTQIEDLIITEYNKMEDK